jgi:hypothetical protein
MIGGRKEMDVSNRTNLILIVTKRIHHKICMMMPIVIGQLVIVYVKEKHMLMKLLENNFSV